MAATFALPEEPGSSMSSAPPSEWHEPPNVLVIPVRPPDRAFEPLPRPLTSLVARESELAAVVAQLRTQDVRLLTLTGPGGVGKTRVAIAAAAAVAGDFRDGLAYVRLGLLSDPALVGGAIAHALGLRDMGADPPVGRLAGFLRDRQILLVLDNFEHVVAASPLVSDLLASCAGLKALVTSRVRLRLSGEREFPVPPLAVSREGQEAGGQDEGVINRSTSRVPPGRLDPSIAGDAVRLFVERAQAVQPDFAATPENIAIAVEICRRLDGLPLAIELAAARVKALPPAVLLNRLEQRLPLLTGGPRDLPIRQQTMRDAVAWSHDLLDPAEQTLFRRLAIFVGGFTLEAAAAVAAGDELRAPRSELESPGDRHPLRADAAERELEALDGVSSLVEQSLLRPVSTRSEGRDQPRYQMMDTVREFGLERLAACEEIEEIRRRHAQFFLQLGETAEVELVGSEQADWLDRLDVEHPNLRTALAWAIDHDPDLALRLGGALRQFWRIRGHLTEGRDTLKRALATGSGTDRARAKALVTAAEIWYLQGDYQATTNLAQEAGALYERLADVRGVATARRMIGHSHLGLAQEADPPDQARFRRALTEFEAALSLRRVLDDRHGLALAVFDLGYLALIQADAGRAAPHLAESLALFEAAGDRRGAAFAVSNLGWVAARQGDDAGAAAQFGRALRVFQELGDREAATHLIEGIAWLVLRTGRTESAARLLGAAAALRTADGIRLALLHRTGHEPAVAAARQTLGDIAFAAAWSAGGALPIEHAIAEALAAIAEPLSSSSGDTAGAAVETRLTPRERDVLRLLADGKSDREIAAALSLSTRTVGWHVSHLLAKLGVESRTAAAAFALRHGLA
jgi:predicted ATPase/DNA-binding CsgD family transcriptional regulator